MVKFYHLHEFGNIIMKYPPSVIDNAEVLEYAWSDVPFGAVRDSSGRIVHEIHGLAICRYAESNFVYRFSCDKNWKVSQDACYGSIEEAKAQLPVQYQEVQVVWHRLPGL